MNPNDLSTRKLNSMCLPNGMYVSSSGFVLRCLSFRRVKGELQGYVGGTWNDISETAFIKE